VTLGWKVIARAAPGGRPLDPFSRLLLIALAALMLLATPLRATEPDWPDDPYTIDIVEQDLIEVLRDFAGTLGISVRISEAVTGTGAAACPPCRRVSSWTFWRGSTAWSGTTTVRPSTSTGSRR
jgi:hypothetical protein